MRRSDARVVEIYVEREASLGAGTGYLLSGGVVITAAHVMRGRTGQVVVRHLGDRTDWHCTVLWQDDEVDAALLRIADPKWTEPPGLAPVRWGRLATDRTRVPFTLSGFPFGMAARWDDNTLVLRDTAHGVGNLNAGPDEDGLLQATLDRPIPPSPTDRLRWKGVSGAAVLVFGCVVGVVVREAGSNGRQLLVLPITTLLTRAGFSDHVSPIAFTPAELQPVLATAWPRRAHSPVSLLSADAEVVRFHGRDELVDQLTSWCDDPTRFSLRLVTGQGGQGKTRLARHLVALARERGWSAGFLADRIDSSLLAVLGDVTTPLLLVVDYAEDRVPQLVALARVLREALRGGTLPRIRLVLLARAEGEWWRRLGEQEPLLRTLSAQAVIPLPPLEPAVGTRAAALSAAVTDLGARLSEVAGHETVTPAFVRELELPDVSAPRFGCALNLHMTGLTVLLQAIDPVDVAKDEDDEAILLLHEQKFWKRTATGFGLGGLDLAARQQLVGVATLCQADAEEEAHAILHRLGVAEEAVGEIAQWLASLYPADNAHWGSLVPDRVGEYLVSVVTDDHPDLLRRLVPAASRPQALRALRILARADVHRPGAAEKLHHLITGHADPLAFTAVEAATTVEHPEPLRQALTTLGRGDDFALLFRLYDVTPLQSQALEAWASALAERLVLAARSACEAEPSEQRKSELARRLNNHAIRLAAQGRYADALVYSAESVTLREELAESGSPAALHDLALTLNTHMNALSDNGNLDEALKAAEELVPLCQRTVELDPADLPMAHYGLAVRRSDLGDSDGAVTAAEEALRLYLELAENAPDVALTLRQLSIDLHDAGRYDEALVAASRALDVYREIAVELPDAHAADVAGAQTTLASALGALGRHEEALAAAAESVRLHRRIRRALPDADPSWYSDALTTYGEILSDVDDQEAALTAFSEAVAVNQALTESGSGVSPARYAQALHNEALTLYVLGRLDDAVPVAERALEVCRPTAAALPLVHGPQFSATLNLMATCLVELGDPERALSAANESVSVCRQLAVLGDGTHDELLATALVSLASVLFTYADVVAENNRRADAAAVTEELVSVARRMAELDEDAAVDLGRALNRHAVALADMDQNTTILATAEEAAELWRGIAVEEPDEFVLDLSTALHLLTVGLAGARRWDEAVAVADEHVRLWVERARTDPDTFLPMLVQARIDRATVLVGASRPEEALLAADSALTDGEGVADLASDLATAHEERARALSILRRPDEALLAVQEGLRLLEELVDADSALHLPYLAAMLHTQAEVLVAAGRPAKALTAADRSVALYTRLTADHPGCFGAALAKATALRHEVLHGR